MQSGEDYVLKVPSKGFFLAKHMLDGVTFGRREGACLSRVLVAAFASLFNVVHKLNLCVRRSYTDIYLSSKPC